MLGVQWRRSADFAIPKAETMGAKVNLVDLGSISHGPKQGNFTRLVCKWHILPHYIPSIYSLPCLLAEDEKSIV